MISPAAVPRILIRGGRIYDHDRDVHQPAPEAIESAKTLVVRSCRDLGRSSVNAVPQRLPSEGKESCRAHRDFNDLA
jgi:hypothetical protein